MTAHHLSTNLLAFPRRILEKNSVKLEMASTGCGVEVPGFTLNEFGVHRDQLTMIENAEASFICSHRTDNEAMILRSRKTVEVVYRTFREVQQRKKRR